MPRVLAPDRVKETTSTTGSGARVLSGVAAAGCQTFASVCQDGDLVTYACAGGAEFEVGVGRYNSASNSITPLEITASSNGGAIVSFGAGSKDIYATMLGDQAPYRSYLTDQSDLLAWYVAESPANTVDTSTPPLVQTMADRSGGGRNTAVAGGAVVKSWRNLLNRRGILEFPSTGAALGDIVLPLKGGFTFFAVVKIISTANYQNLIARNGAGASLACYWDQPTNKWQIGSVAVSTTAGVAGSWRSIVLSFFNSGGTAQALMRDNGIQVYAGVGSSAGNAVPGSVAVPSNVTMHLFSDGTLPFRSQVAEWGMYAVSKNGNEAALEAYLRQKYGTW